MCGIFGAYLPHLPLSEFSQQLKMATSALAHRGPDASGQWISNHGMGLAHTRLSILDLSDLGAQPYLSQDKSQVIVYNGEIYNFKSIAEELNLDSGYVCKSQCDTEVLSAGIRHWGVEKILPKTNGMFAFAVWDDQNRTLTIARDRLGIKPLYYGWARGYGFVFASELKAFFTLPNFREKLSQEALSLFFEHGYITAPYTIFNGIYKLIPGTFLTLGYEKLVNEPDNFSPFCEYEQGCNFSNVIKPNAIKPHRFWYPPAYNTTLYKGNYGHAIEDLHHLLKDAVNLRTIADVPLGAFLSGGIDSSLIVSLLAAAGGVTKTFSIGFNERGYDEAPFAKAIAKHLGTDHHELYVTSEEALSVVPEITTIYDEPFADSSQIPTTIVSRLAKKHVTVSLSGDGGDELFCGYSRYAMAPEVWKYVRLLPPPLRAVIRRLIQAFPEQSLEICYQLLMPILPKRFRKLPHVGYKLGKLAGLLGCKTLGELYRLGNSHWPLEQHPSGAFATNTALQDPSLEEKFKDSIEYFSFMDMQTYLPDDILTKVDRASMSCGLEARVPLLDYRVVEFSKKLPLPFKYYQQEQKRILRSLLEQYVPKRLFDRPKTGFGIPLDQWLRGELREWGEDLFSESKLPSNGVLNRERVTSCWKNHLTGRSNSQYLIWDVLVFQDWFYKWQKHIEL